MIKLDFHGGLHGHFLEYVANVWIMQTQPNHNTIFNEHGAAHAKDPEYRESRMIYCGHYSRYEPDQFNSSDQIIRITIDLDDRDRFFIATTNLIYRAGERGWDQQMLSIPTDIRQDPVGYRNNWYSKLAESDLYMTEFNQYHKVDYPVFEFDFAAFFTYNKFCHELQRLAGWLDQTFFPDRNLWLLWQEFIQRNQGYQSWLACEQLLAACLNGEDSEIHATILEQAWLNYSIARITRMYSGTVFDSANYPKSTREIYQEIQNHLNNLRNPL